MAAAGVPMLPGSSERAEVQERPCLPPLGALGARRQRPQGAGAACGGKSGRAARSGFWEIASNASAQLQVRGKGAQGALL